MFQLIYDLRVNLLGDADAGKNAFAGFDAQLCIGQINGHDYDRDFGPVDAGYHFTALAVIIIQ